MEKHYGSQELRRIKLDESALPSIEYNEPIDVIHNQIERIRTLMFSLLRDHSIEVQWFNSQCLVTTFNDINFEIRRSWSQSGPFTVIEIRREKDDKTYCLKIVMEVNKTTHPPTYVNNAEAKISKPLSEKKTVSIVCKTKGDSIVQYDEIQNGTEWYSILREPEFDEDFDLAETVYQCIELFLQSKANPSLTKEFASKYEQVRRF